MIFMMVVLNIATFLSLEAVVIRVTFVHQGMSTDLENSLQIGFYVIIPLYKEVQKCVTWDSHPHTSWTGGAQIQLGGCESHQSGYLKGLIRNKCAIFIHTGF